jgi:hypothetical protein
VAQKNARLDMRNTVEKHQAYFTCADQVAKAYARPDQKVVYYLLSDSEHLKKDALKHLPERVIVSGLGVRHTELFEAQGKGMQAEADGMMDSIAESWMVAGTDFQILTARSGFGKIRSFRFLHLLHGRKLKLLEQQHGCEGRKGRQSRFQRRAP